MCTVFLNYEHKEQSEANAKLISRVAELENTLREAKERQAHLEFTKKILKIDNEKFKQENEKKDSQNSSSVGSRKFSTSSEETEVPTAKSNVIKHIKLWEELTQNQNTSDLDLSIDISGQDITIPETYNWIKKQLLKLTLKISTYADSYFGMAMDMCNKITSLRTLSIDFSCYRKVPDLALPKLKFAGSSKLLSLQLDFSYCENITDNSLGKLGDNVARLLHLESLDLKFCSCKKLSDSGFTKLTFQIKRMTSLNNFKLDFSWCNISDDGVIEFLENLENLELLHKLSLSFNGTKVTDIGLNTITDTVDIINALEDVSIFLTNCDISPETNREANQNLQMRFKRFVLKI